MQQRLWKNWLLMDVSLNEFTGDDQILFKPMRNPCGFHTFACLPAHKADPQAN